MSHVFSFVAVETNPFVSGAAVPWQRVIHGVVMLAGDSQIAFPAIAGITINVVYDGVIMRLHQNPVQFNTPVINNALHITGAVYAPSALIDYWKVFCVKQEGFSALAVIFQIIAMADNLMAAPTGFCVAVCDVASCNNGFSAARTSASPSCSFFRAHNPFKDSKLPVDRSGQIMNPSRLFRLPSCPCMRLPRLEGEACCHSPCAGSLQVRQEPDPSLPACGRH